MEVIVSFLAQGAFNKIYDIQSGKLALIFRVSLPVDPQYKTLSEGATIDWIWLYTSLLVPEVIAHHASRESLLGFEWIHMKKISGKSLADTWKYMEYSTRSALSDLFRLLV